MDWTNTEDIKKRWQEYKELYKKDLNDPNNHNGVITHLEPDTLMCKVKCALRSITTNKTSGDDGIPVELFQILIDGVKVMEFELSYSNPKRWSEGDGIRAELFQILKDDAVKVLHSTCQQIWKTQQWPQDWKRSIFIPIPKKGNAKECSDYCTIAH